jgi:integrase
LRGQVGRRLLALGPTKTYETRWVSMPAFVAEALQEHVERYPSPDGHLFSAAEGGPLRHRNFMRRHFKPAVDRIGLPPALRFHDLRHMAAAFMIAEGASMELQAAARALHDPSHERHLRAPVRGPRRPAHGSARRTPVRV